MTAGVEPRDRDGDRRRTGTLEYLIVDVFTPDAGQPFAGNPLAVVLGADALSTAQCQALAIEFNLSETVFPMAADHARRRDYRARIFTPSSELPFAGHPSVGVAWTLHHLGRLPAGEVVQECGAGLVQLEIPDAGGPVDADRSAADDVGADRPRSPARCRSSGRVRPRRVAPAVRGLRNPVHLPERASRRRWTRSSPISPLSPRSIPHGDRPAPVCLAGRPGGAGSRIAVRARMFAADIGGEDPATGSASLGFARLARRVGTGLAVKADRLHDQPGRRDGPAFGARLRRHGRPAGRSGGCGCRATRRLVASGRIRVP